MKKKKQGSGQWEKYANTFVINGVGKNVYMSVFASRYIKHFWKDAKNSTMATPGGEELPMERKENYQWIPFCAF